MDQTVDFPDDQFQLIEDELHFHGIDLMSLVEQYGTPFRFTYLPKITENIQNARKWFNIAIAKNDYQGKYFQCYCTKTSHFHFILDEVLKNKVHIETSSAYDIDIVRSLEQEGMLDKQKYIVCNGYKMSSYLEKIADLINDGFENVIPVLDNMDELESLEKLVPDKHINIGLRIASEEEPKFEFYTSRLGIRYKDIIPFYNDNISTKPNVSVKMLHFFINTGIRDTAYYWNELSKSLGVYTRLKKLCPTLDSLNIGGGFPIKNSLVFDYDYEYMADNIVLAIKEACEEEEVPEPHIFTEFGSFTVGESGGIIYKIIAQKKQNDREKWNMIDSSFMTTLPDIWAISQRFIMLPLNKWTNTYERVFLGGLTCDSDDYYNSEQHVNAIYLPKYEEDSPLYIGFFNTGAYQESISGYGGIQHCLTPAPKHILINKDPETGEISTRLFSKEQSHKSMLKILGYKHY